jgi:hypothetical protein
MALRRVRRILMVPKKTQRTPLPMDGSTGTKTKRSDTMNHGMPLNSAFTAHLIAAEERHQIMLRASHQRRLLKESERAFGKVRASRPSRIRRGFGSLLTRAAERLMGAPGVESKSPALSIKG